MQQQAPSMMPVMPSFPPANITTEQIQKDLDSETCISVDAENGALLLRDRKPVRELERKAEKIVKVILKVSKGSPFKYLDENKKLILAILDNQNLGKLAECAQYQAQLQKNLMYLAAIADAQPQMATVPAQVAPHPAMQQGAYYMQQQAAAMAQQHGIFPPRMPAQFNSPLQMHDQHQQQQHPVHQQQQQQAAIPGQMNFRPTGPSDSVHPMQPEAALGGGNSGGPPASASPNDGRGANKQDGPEGGSVGDGQGNTAAGAGQNPEEGK